MTTIVADLDRARLVLRGGPRCAGLSHRGASAGSPQRLRPWSAPRRVVELARADLGGPRLARDLAEHGELPHAMTFKVADLDAVQRHLADVGIGVAERSDARSSSSPADLSNAVVALHDPAAAGRSSLVAAPAVPSRQRFVTNDGLRIRYLDSDPSGPEGLPVVFVPGHHRLRRRVRSRRRAVRLPASAHRRDARTGRERLPVDRVLRA